MRFQQVGKRLKQIREHLGMTQKEFAKHIDASYRGWQANESGTMPGGELLLKLISIGVNVNWVLSGESEPWSRTVPESDSNPANEPYINLQLFDRISQNFLSHRSPFHHVPFEHLIPNIIAVYNGAMELNEDKQAAFIDLQLNIFHQQSCLQQLAQCAEQEKIVQLKSTFDRLKTEEASLRTLINTSMAPDSPKTLA